MRFTPSLPTPRPLLLLSTAWVFCHAAQAQAQTVFAHDPGGNRAAQQAAGAPEAPFITTMPAHQTGKLGGTARFSVIVGGQGPFTYQWLKNGAPIDGATSDTLVLTGLVAGDFTPSPWFSPSYSVQVTNAHGSVLSVAADLYQDSLGAGLPDWWRTYYFPTAPASVSPYADADGDGVTNAQEYADGTKPNDGSSRLARVTLAGPQSLMSKLPVQDTYAAGTVVNATGSHDGALQFGGFTGSFRNQGSLGMIVPGSNGSPGDVVLKGLFGSMPVQKAGTAPAFTYASGEQASVEGFATSPAGWWMACGYFNQVNGQPMVGVARFTTDGTLDASFNPSPNGEVKGMAMLPDGKTLLAGLFGEIYGQPRPGIVRFLASGAVDTSFAPVSGVADTLVLAMEVQKDGRVLLGGQIPDGSTYRQVARLHTDGSIDTAFTTTVNDLPHVLRQQPDGKILMGGDFTQVNGIAVPKLVRLNLDGTLDGSFNVTEATGAITTRPARLLVQPDGKILVGGSVQVRLNGGNVTLPLVRLNADGTVDSAFTQKVHALVPGVTFADIALQTDGRIVGVGTFTLANPSVVNAVRFKADGSVDPDCFVISRPNAPVRTVAAQMDGSLLIGGRFSDVAVADAMVNNHRYYVTPARMSWSAAEAHAVKLGGHLVSIGGAKENSFVANVLVPSAIGSFPTWIGLQDVGTEGLFSWTSGDLANFSSWHGGEPNNYNNEDVSAINYFANGIGNWVDTPDAGVPNPGLPQDGPYYGIIEVDPGSTPPTTKNWVAGRDMAANEKAGGAAKTTNPNPTVPAWSYGRRATLASTGLTLFDRRHADGAIEGWEATNYCGVLVNTTPAPGFYLGPRPVHPEEMYLHPGSNLEYAIVRWTAPQAGTYVATGFWQDFSWGMGDGGSASIVVNGAVVFNAIFDNGSGALDTKVLSLNAGDTVDFALGARGGFEADGTRFNAVVTQVEEGLSDLWWAGNDLATNEKPDGHAKETTNPNPTAPAWSYGKRNSILTSGIELHAGAESHLNGGGVHGPMEGWAQGSAIIVNTNGDPNTPPPHVYNYGFGPNLPFNAREILVGPGASGGPYPILRWTAPEAGRYDVFAYWQDSDAHGGNGVTGFILVNGAQVYGQDMDNGGGCSTVQSLDLKAGDWVDFALGDRGDFSFDVTKFNAVIVRPIDSTPGMTTTGTLTQAATRADISASDKIDWATAAPNNTDIPANPFVIDSSAGVRYHVRKPTLGSFKRLTQGSGWAGNFAPGDALLNHGNSDGPVIIEAASRGGVFSALGMQVMSNQDGPFVATLRAYDVNGVLLGTFTANGTGNAGADNSAVFIGVKSTGENIHSISVDTDSTGFGGDFAINQVSIKGSMPSSLSNLRTNFARLVTTNSMRPLDFYSGGWESIFPANGSATLHLTSAVSGTPVTFATLESSPDGATFQPFSYGVATDSTEWSFPVAALPPGFNYFRAMLRNGSREEARTHAVALVTPPVVTSQTTAAGEVGIPFTYTGTATGRLTGFTTTAVPAWATATFDANSSRLTITGTPTSGGTHQITLHPANEAGSTPATLTLSITSSFTAWQEANFTPAELANPNIAGPLGDATGAGVPNLLKYALGIPPKRPGNSGMPVGTVAQNGASKHLTLTYTRALDADVSIEVQVCGNLTTWVSGSEHTTEVSRVSNGDNTETVTIRDNTPVANGIRRFMRLKVSEAP